MLLVICLFGVQDKLLREFQDSMNNLYHALVITMHYFIHSQSENHTNNKIAAIQHTKAIKLNNLAAVACNSMKAIKFAILIFNDC